ncbi:TolC family outer membrane protein [Thermomonas flagellata]|uniref:TolC family outer membrane protein n=1 Tax=Thermomonas flagellata TaxID=2888524 RepID=UPI001F039F14|nr:TolC family outer membrane protein [Thermomonas flagellata]
MLRRPLALALALVLLPAAAAAEDLVQVYQQARSSDPQYAAAEANRLIGREGAVQARAALLPQVSGSASYQRNRSTGPSIQTQFDPVTGQPIRFSGDSTTTTNTRRYGVGVNQVLLDFGKFSQLRSQNALSQAADYQYEAAGQSLITRTAQAYFNVLVALETLNAAEASEAAFKKQADFASKRLEVGLAPITDVYEARAQYDGARATTIQARNAVLDAYQALLEITGTPVSSLKGLPEDFQPGAPGERDAEAWVAQATANNPALKALELQLKSAEADVATARAAHLPTLNFSGGWNKSATWGDSTFTSRNPPFSATFPIGNDSRGPSVGVTLNVPLFAGGAIQSRVRQALAQRDAVQDQLEQQRRALARNTRNAYQTVMAGISQVEAQRQAVRSAQSAYDASQVGLEVGTRTVLDVLNNQRILFSARQAYAQAKYNYLLSRLQLEQAAGTLQPASLEDINRLLSSDESLARVLGKAQ